MHTAALCVALLGLGATPAAAAEVAVQASADGDTSLLAPLTPNGRATTMRASTTGTAYVRFDVPVAPTKLLRAVLQLPVAKAAGGTLKVQRTQTGWTESSLTYLRPPARIGGTLATVGVPPGGGTLAVDVTSSVTAGQPASFALDRDALDAAVLRTRESGAGPRLVLTIAGAAQHRLAGLLSQPGQSGAAHYDTRDDRGTGLDALDIVTAPSPAACDAAGIPAGAGTPPCYLGVHHVHSNGRFSTQLAASRDLAAWRHVRELDAESSQPSLAVLPDGSMLLAAEHDERDPVGNRLGSHIRVLHWPSATALLTPDLGPDVTFDAEPRQLSTLNEGTPDVAFVDWAGTLAASKIHFGLHWYDAAAGVDRAATATLTGLGGPAPVWSAVRDEATDSTVRAVGVAGNVGDRDRLLLDGRALTVVEGQRVRNDFGTWSLYVVDPVESAAERVEMVTPGRSASVGNPSVELLALPDGIPGLVATAFVFSEGAGPSEAGELVFWRRLG